MVCIEGVDPQTSHTRDELYFVDFTDDLVVWVVFYDPEGGEAATTGGDPTGQTGV